MQLDEFLRAARHNFLNNEVCVGPEGKSRSNTLYTAAAAVAGTAESVAMILPVIAQLGEDPRILAMNTGSMAGTSYLGVLQELAALGAEVILMEDPDLNRLDAERH